MEEPLQILANLAREYERKYNQLADALRQADPGHVPLQLKMRAELATDQFRAAQMNLLSSVSSEALIGQGAAYEALISLFRSFDEIRIVYQLLFEHVSGRTEQPL